MFSEMIRRYRDRRLRASGAWIGCDRLMPAPFTRVRALLSDGTEAMLGYAVYHTPQERLWTVQGGDGLWNVEFEGRPPTHWKPIPKDAPA